MAFEAVSVASPSVVEIVSVYGPPLVALNSSENVDGRGAAGGQARQALERDFRAGRGGARDARAGAAVVAGLQHHAVREQRGDAEASGRGGGSVALGSQPGAQRGEEEQHHGALPLVDFRYSVCRSAVLRIVCPRATNVPDGRRAHGMRSAAVRDRHETRGLQQAGQQT